MEIGRGVEVVLLSPPYDFPPRPSIALALFKACLERDGITSTTLYPMFRMSELMGREAILEMYRMPPVAMCEEYLFSDLTGLKGCAPGADLDAYVSFIVSNRPELDAAAVRALLEHGTAVAHTLLEETAREVAELAPRVLAISSVFYQLTASLAIARRVKELDRDILVLMGGPNCMGESGAAVLRYAPWVDAVFFGEGDEVFSEAVIALEEDAPLPYGCLRREDLSHGEVRVDELPYRLTRDLETMPIPDYGDFMPYLEHASDELKELWQMGYDEEKKPMLLIEGSRGCWWGQRRPCSFCGLNGLKNVYRVRSAERILQEVTTLHKRYGTSTFELTDNVIPTRFVRELVPLLEESPQRFRFFAEVKPIFTADEMRGMSRAGFSNLQAGLETMNDHLLELLNKGGSVANNIRFLKCYKQTGIMAYWNMLFRIPGEQAKDYEEMLELLPKLFHLQPPTGYTEICYERRGAYVREQERFGLKMVPKRGYHYLFGDDDQMIALFAQHYDDVSEEEARIRRETRPYYDRLVDLIREWGATYWRKVGCHLIMEERGEHLVMMDTRPCAKMSVCFLKGIAYHVALACDVPRTFVELAAALRDEGIEVSDEDLLDCLAYLIDSRYVVFVSERYLTLAVRQDV